MAARCNGQSDVSKIEFTSLTRGYQKQVFIDKDSLTVLIDGRQSENRIVKRKLAAGEWKTLTDELKNIDPTKLPEYKSPTNRRAFDGAKHSTVKLISGNGSEFSHTFDDLEPHKDLKKFLNLILKMENAEKP